MNKIKFEQLSQDQKDIINCTNSAVVIAAPGSGKTTTLAFKISGILKQINQEFRGIIGISYTNKASDELKKKVEQITPDLCNSFFGTIDKFYVSEIIIPFSKSLYRIKKEINIISEKDDNDLAILAILNIYDLKEQLIKLLKEGMLILEYIPFLANHIFDESIDCRNYIEARYTHIFIDEYQDCGEYQNIILTKIIGLGLTGTVVGDPDQSIFRFSGSDSKYLFELAERSDFEVFSLLVNRRSHKSIVDYSLKFLKNDKDIPISEDRRVFGIRVNGDETVVSNWIDEYIPKIMAKYSIGNISDIAVLTRGERTARFIKQSLKIESVFYCKTPLDSSVKKVDSFAKKIIMYVLGNENVFLENIIEDHLLELNNKQNNLFFSNIKKIKNDYEKTQKINEIDLVNSIKQIFSEETDYKNIEKTLLNNEYVASFKPLDKNKLPIMTIHKSKGLEFNVVIILDLHKFIIPMHDFKTRSYKDLSECSNIHYVAITRAKDLVILCFNTIRHNSDNDKKQGEYSEFIDPNIRSDLIAYRNQKSNF